MANYQRESVIPFAPAAKSARSNDADRQLESAGQTILNLLHEAANVAEENSQRAFDMAQKLSDQLRAAESRIAELEANVRYYQDRCDRADQWLHKIYLEIEERFLKADARRRPGVLPGRQFERTT